MQSIETKTTLSRRRASIARARASFNASLPREGRIQRACRRALIAHDGLAHMHQLRAWCYPGQARQHWHHGNIARTLKRLGAKRIGWGVYATYARHSK
jgi:hypothetical protein